MALHCEFQRRKRCSQHTLLQSKKSVFETSGLKTKDVVKQIILTDKNGSESEVRWIQLTRIPVPATLTFTVERGSGKKLQELTVNVPVKWNENEVAHSKSISSDSSTNQKIQKQIEQRETAPADRTFAKEKTSAQKNAEASTGGTNSAFTIGFSKPIDSFTNTSNQTFGVSAAWESGSNSAMINILQLDLFFNNQIHSLLNYDLGASVQQCFRNLRRWRTWTCIRKRKSLQ